jgi:hypothetical protein
VARVLRWPLPSTPPPPLRWAIMACSRMNFISVLKNDACCLVHLHDIWENVPSTLIQGHYFIWQISFVTSCRCFNENVVWPLGGYGLWVARANNNWQTIAAILISSLQVIIQMYAGFGLFTAVVIKFPISLDVTICWLINSYQRHNLILSSIMCMTPRVPSHFRSKCYFDDSIILIATNFSIRNQPWNSR